MKLHEAMTEWLVYELQREGFRWAADVARYRDNKTGRFVSEKSILDIGEGFADFAKQNMGSITERYTSGKIDINQWQKAMRQEIKDSHLVNVMAGRGGRDSMTQSDWGRQGARLRQQYGYLDNLAWERVNGTVSDAQMKARAEMYAGKSRTAFYDGKTAAHRDVGFVEERRVLNPAEHCADCIAYAAMGWVQIGTLPEPGEGSVCRANCKCNKEYRTEEVSE